jgi:hypothetical protein
MIAGIAPAIHCREYRMQAILPTIPARCDLWDAEK